LASSPLISGRLTARLAFAGAALVALLPTASIAQNNPFASCLPTDAASQSGIRTEPVEGGGLRFRLTGNVEIPCQGSTIYADEVVYDDRTQEVHATGHVVLNQPDLTVYAERAVFHRQTRLGTFYQASGWARIGDDPAMRQQFGTQEPDVQFHGEEISKIGPKTYQIRNGGFTSCVQATPRWEMATANTTMTLDKHALLRHVVLKVKDVPLLYIPVLYYPINKEDRATGFLLPQYGSSTLQGTSLSNAFFLALGRSQDATFYHDWYSKTGQGLGADYRYVSGPSGRGDARLYMMNESEQLASDGTVTQAARRSFQVDGNANHGLPRGFRAYGRVNYFTDAAVQQLYQNIEDFSERSRSFNGTVTGTLGRYRLNATVDQRDVFYGTTRATRVGRAPSFNVAMAERPIGRSKIYAGASGDAVYTLRQDDLNDPDSDRSLWRFDGGPSVRAPLSSLPFLSATGTASWRLTRWLESLDPITGDQVPVALTRQMLELRGAFVGPVLTRVFLTPDNGYADGFKHLIEPSVTVLRTLSPFAGYFRTVNHDSVDSLVPEVTSVDYRLTNRILARRRGPAPLPGAAATPGVAREILSVEIGQTYYSKSLAASVDPQYQSNSGVRTDGASNFSALRLTATSQPFNATTAEFRMEIDPTHRTVKTLRASGSFGSEQVRVNAGWTKRRMIPGLVGFERGDHYLNASTTIQTRDNAVAGTYAFDLDIANRTWVQQRILASYNTQCCGVSFDWQAITSRFYPGGSNRRFGISFSLAGIGSFSNPLGSFGGQ
jgi:LPS-assembly protein